MFVSQLQVSKGFRAPSSGDSAAPDNLKTLVFQENSGKAKFQTWLSAACKELDAYLAQLGIAVEDIGSHSIRKVKVYGY